MSLTIRPGRFRTVTPLGVLHVDDLLNKEQVDLLVHAMRKHGLVPKQVTEATIDAQGGITLTAYHLDTNGNFVFTADGELLETEFA